MWKSRTTLLMTLLLAVAAPAAAQQWTQVAPTGWLGITLQPTWMLEGGHCRPTVMVTRVMKGAPADRAGIQEGDLLLRVNGQDAVEQGLAWMANRLEPGDTVKLAVRREDRVREFRAIAGERPEGMPLVTATPPDRQAGGIFAFGPQPSRVFRTGHDSIVVCSGDPTGVGFVVPRADFQMHVTEARVDSLRHEIARHVLEARVMSADSAFADSNERYIVRVGPAGNTVVVTGRSATSFVSPRELGVGSRAVAGAEFSELNPDLARYFHGAQQGLLVLQVVPGTPAARAGLRAGDVITRAGNETINTIGDLRRVVAFGQRPLRIEIVRDGRQRQLSLPQD